MKLTDVHKLFLGLNTDDAPAFLKPGELVDALNCRIASSSEQHGAGNLETLQSEIELLLNVSAPITYYGDSIGGEFIYAGFEEVVIGNQTWMKKNYDVNYPGSKVYNDDDGNADIYGRFYTHEQAMQHDFCPAGWHVPTEAEADDLLSYIGGLMIGGGKLKEAGTERWNTPNTGADDAYGFRALPGGKFDDVFALLGLNGLFWLRDDVGPVAPVALNGSEITYTSFITNWNAVVGANGYYLDVATDVGFTAMVAGYNNINIGNVLSAVVNGLSDGTEYFYRVRAYNEVGASENSNVKSVNTLESALDWFLASQVELSEMRDELHSFGIGNFSNTWYWSSSENGSDEAWCMDFGTGIEDSWEKDIDTIRVRACRTFDSVVSYNPRDIGPAGGLIFIAFELGGGINRYYEAALLDQSSGHVWSNVYPGEIGTTGTAIGTGQVNTAAIIAQPGHIDSAAKLCDDYIP